MSVIEKLFENQDLKYKEFTCKLIPNIDCDTVIGVRTPILRKLIKEFKLPNHFINNLPHKYYEENNIHAFIIGQIKDFDVCIEEINRFLPYVDNWATCDSIRPKCFKGNNDRLLESIKLWLASSHTYTVRFGIEMLMIHYLDECFDVKILEYVSEIRSDEYYINMVIAWYFATALTKQWDASVFFIEQKRLPTWIHNKTIQKAIESNRVTTEQKTYLKTLKQAKKL